MQDSVANFIIDRLAFGSLEDGTLIPPTQRGPFRVPLISRVRIIKKTTTATGADFILAWQDSETDLIQKIERYNVLVRAEGSPPAAPRLISSVEKSPAAVSVTAATGAVITFFIQAVSTGSMSAPAASSPTVTSVV